MAKTATWSAVTQCAQQGGVTAESPHWWDEDFFQVKICCPTAYSHNCAFTGQQVLAANEVEVVRMLFVNLHLDSRLHKEATRFFLTKTNVGQNTVRLEYANTAQNEIRYH
jgi:hypothetical protein